MQTEVALLSGDRKVVSPVGKTIVAGKGYWTIWVLALAIVGIIHISTLSIAPYLHSDEFTIVELGRIMLHPTTDWGLPWLTNKDQPVFIWFYVGPMLQEFSFQVIGQYGPRVSSLIGAFIAATILVRWLKERGVSKLFAIALGLIYLLDPIFVQSYTMGRLDGWAMAFCFCSCLILHRATESTKVYSQVKYRLMLSGALAGFACFIWPSAVFLFPLLLIEFQLLISKYWSKYAGWKNIFILLFFWGAGCFLISVFLLLPISSLFLLQFENIMQGIKANTQTGPLDMKTPFYQHVLSSIILMVKSFKYSPILPIISVIAVIHKKDLVVAIATSVAIISLFCTVVYLHRIQYLVPYFIIAISGLLTRPKDTMLFSPGFLQRIRTSILITMLVWASFLSLVARQVLAREDASERERVFVYRAAKKMIGRGAHSVFLPAPEFYYAGRDLGWKMYRPYTGVGDTISPKALHIILAHVNNAIMPEWELTQDFKQILIQEGFIQQGLFQLYKEPYSEANTGTTNETRLRNLFAIFRQPYGPYILYVRKSTSEANRAKLY